MIVVLLFLAFGPGPAEARAVRVLSPNDFAILAPLEPDGAIVASASFRYVFAPNPRGNVPQSGDWTLDWAGGGGLPAGHYEGKVNCLAWMVSVQLDPFLVTAAGDCTLRSPGQGVIIQHMPVITTNNPCPSATGDQPFRMEWQMDIRATGVYAGLSGHGVAVIQGLC